MAVSLYEPGVEPMSESKVPRPLNLPRFAVPISLILALLAVAAFAAVACRGEAEPGPGASARELTPSLGVVGPLAATAQEKTGAVDEDELDEFVPTEEVSADHSVSFPVDI